MFFKKLFLRKLFLWDLLSVVPASAGVIPHLEFVKLSVVGRSRECGGDPKAKSDMKSLEKSFPRVRG